MKNIALIGYGAIAHMVVDELAQEEDQIKVRAVLVRTNRAAAAREELPDHIAVVSNITDLLSLSPELVVECAGQSAIHDYAEAVLRSGIDLMMIATGAFAEAGLLDYLTECARCTGARLLLPAGAIAGIDGLTALRLGGLDRVIYTSTKPPEAWRETPAEKIIHLDSLTEPTVFFAGSPIDAARHYPKNANLAMTVALAGIGVERTEVHLVADPNTTNNTGRIHAEGRFGRLRVEMEGQPTPNNPKTSASTALSMVHAIRNLTATVIMP